MDYLAFDVSKDKLDIVLTDLRSKEKYFQIKNEKEAINAWLGETKLSKRLVTGSESTAGYHLLLQKILVEKGYDFRLLNPILTKQFIRSTIRKKKTDKSDSLIIARLLGQGEGRKIGASDLDMSVKIEQRISGKLVSEKHRLRMMRKSLKLHFGLDDFIDKTLEELEDAVDEKIKAYDKALEEKHGDNTTIRHLMSITGIGFKLALIIYSEIGDIDRFQSPKQLVAFAGLDSKVRKSGSSVNSTGKLTKRGSPRLRYALFIAARSAARFDPDMKEYYGKKIMEGKKHTVAVVATSRKMLNRVFIVWKRQTPYIRREMESVKKRKLD